MGVLNAAASAAAEQPWQEGLDIRFTQSEAPAEDGSNAGADLHRGTLRVRVRCHWQAKLSSEKFSQDGPQRDIPVFDKDRKFGLGDSASPCIRKIPEEQISGD